MKSCEPRWRKKAWGMVTLLLMVFSCLSACGRRAEYIAPPPMEVTVNNPLRQEVTDYAEFTGTMDAVESVEIRARVEGYLESIRFQPGSRVKIGELLFVIDPRPFQAKLDEAKAELARRQAELKQAEATFRRKEAAFKANAVSELDIIQARADHDVSKAAVQAALANIETAELNLSYTRIHAPINGRISRNLVDVGNLVGATDRTLLATIVNDDPIYAYFNVSERDLLYYRKRHVGQLSPTSTDGKTPVFLGLSDQQDYPFEGRIDYVDNRLDTSTGTIRVRGVFSNGDRRLLAGLFARLRVPVGKRENVLLVPETAIGSDQRGDFLLAVNEKNIVEYRPVTVGAQIKDLRVIESGISPEDRLIVVGLQRARPGLPVVPVEASQPAAGSAGASGSQGP